jgi:hypothetical protein
MGEIVPPGTRRGDKNAVECQKVEPDWRPNPAG